MHLEFIPVRGQKFDIGRTINPANCTCQVCTFMSCPKKNYVLKMTRKRYTIDDFWRERRDEILRLNHPQRWQYEFRRSYSLRLSFDLLQDFFDFLCFSFPKGTYWRADDAEYRGEYDDIGNQVYKTITLIKFSRSGNEIPLGYIKIGDPKINDYDLNERQHKLAEKIRDALLQLKIKVFEHYQEKDLEKNIGWLSPEGRHYPCGHCEHTTLANALGSNELWLEAEGWVKIVSDHDDGFFLNSRTGTAEQRNWLSEHGYILED